MSTSPELTYAIEVYIEPWDKSKPGIVVRNPLVHEFMEWCIVNEVLPLRGTTSCGPHYYHGVFPAEEAQNLRKFFDAHTKLVFDNKLWNENGGDAEPDNSIFWQPATVLFIDDEPAQTATVRFHHDNRVSRGHFLSGMRDLP